MRYPYLLLAPLLPGVAMAQSAADYTLPPLSTLTAILERPLFDPDRRGPAAGEPPATVPAPASPGGDRLLGLVRRGGQALALLSLGGATLGLAPGQEAGGWRLTAIDRDAATFQAPDGRSLRLTVGARLPSLP